SRPIPRWLTASLSSAVVTCARPSCTTCAPCPARPLVSRKSSTDRACTWYHKKPPSGGFLLPGSGGGPPLQAGGRPVADSGGRGSSMVGALISPKADGFVGVWRDGAVSRGHIPGAAVLELLARTGKMITRDLRIKNKVFQLQGDEVYLGSMGVEFEPHTVALLDSLCDVDSNIIDVGANIGLTSLAMTRTSPEGQIRAVEPVADAYRHLQANIELNQAINISCFNFAAGRESSRVKMFVDDRNLASAFVTDRDVTDEDAI